MYRQIAAKSLTRRSHFVNTSQGRLLHPNSKLLSRSSTACADNLEIRASPGKGLGLFATKDIAASSRIIADPALILLHQGEDLLEAHQQFLGLSHEAKALFLTFQHVKKPERDRELAQKLTVRRFSASEISEMIQVAAIFLSNGFNVPCEIEKQISSIYGMFANVSRINHSCLPNVHSNFNANSGKMMVHTLFDIEKGTELYLSYFNPVFTCEERLTKAAQWGFECSCSLCTAESDGEENDHVRKRKSIRKVEVELASLQASHDASVESMQNAINLAHKLLYLVLPDKYLRPILPIAYDNLAAAQMKLLPTSPSKSLMGNILENLMEAWLVECAITGNDSHSSMKRKEKLNQYARLFSAAGIDRRE